MVRMDLERIARLGPVETLESAGTHAAAARLDTLDALARSAAVALHTSIGLICLDEGETLRLVGRHGTDLPRVRREDTFCDQALRELQPLVVSNARLDPRFQSSPFVTGQPGLLAYAGAPLISDTGEVMGTICVLERYGRSFEAGEILSLLRLADLASQALSDMYDDLRAVPAKPETSAVTNN